MSRGTGDDIEQAASGARPQRGTATVVRSASRAHVSLGNRVRTTIGEAGTLVPQLFRFGCAGAVLIVIAALTSVGLYAMVAGGVPWASTSTRTTPGGAQVLVTIQAAPVTPTSSVSAGTQMPAVSQPARPISPAAVITQPSAAPAPAAATAPPVAGTATSAPPGAASTPGPSATVTAPPAVPASGPATANPSSRATHEGLALEIIDVERGWQVRALDGSVIQRRDGSALVTIQVRLLNEAPELRFLADTDLVLVADDGARLAPRQTPPLREPHLLTVPVPSRDSVRGWLTYDVPAGSESTRLQWSPTRPDRPRADATYLLTLPR